MNKLIKLKRIEIFKLASNKLQNEQITAPAVLGIKLGLLSREINPILEEFEKSKEELIKKLGDKVQDEVKGEYYQVRPDNMTEFITEIENLYKAEFEIVNTIDIKYLDNINLPIWYSDALVDFIKE